MLEAEKLSKDPRIEKAKQLVLDTIADHQKAITSVKPADPSLKIEYLKLLEEFAAVRGAKLFYPYIGSGLGNGPLVELMDGSIKYDFICGIGAHYAGHNHPALTSASIDASLSDLVMQGHLQQNRDAIELSELLIQTSGLDHCFLSTTGAMANENGLKLILQKKSPANRILAFDHCFMGRTLALSQVTDKPIYREGLPLNIGVDYVPFYDPAKPEESTRKALEVLLKHIHRYPKQHAVMVMELVQGEGGFYPGSETFFKEIIGVLKEYNIAVLIDEVQTFGRTPELYAFQYFKLQKIVDIVTIGKLSQVCATLFTKEYAPKPGLLSQTFTASTSAIRASIAIIHMLLNGGFFGPEGRITELQNMFMRELKKLHEKHPELIKGPFGLGAMVAFTPLGGDPDKVVAFVKALFDAGVISFIAGHQVHRCRLLIPAICITERHIQDVMGIIETTLLKCDKGSP